MFKNRELKVSVVKTPKPAAGPVKETHARIDPLFINYLFQDNVQRMAILVGVGYAAKKVLDTASEISLIAARSKFQ